jgi:hypothetical protein
VPGNSKRDLKYSMEVISSFFGVANGSQQAATAIRKHTGGFETLYNPDAFQYLADHSKKPANDMLPFLNQERQRVSNLPLSQHDLKPFPPDSIIVKANWQEVPKDSEGAVLTIFIPTCKCANDGRNCKECGRSIRVVQNGEECKLAPLPTDPSTIVTVPISCFYNVDANDNGSRFILFGLHVITKELPDWTWSTFWWYIDPNVPGYGDDRPTTIDNPWRNYLMATTISMDQPEEAEATPDKGASDPCGQASDKPTKANICFNPFLEGGLLNGRFSNCMNCHKRSTYPLDHPEMMGLPRRGVLSSDNPCFAGKIRLDYIWSLRRTPGQQLGNFERFLGQVSQELKTVK